MKLKLLFAAALTSIFFFACNKEVDKPSKEIVLTEDITIFKPIVLSSGMRLDGRGFSVTLGSGANCPVILIGDTKNKPDKVENVTVSNVKVIGNSKHQPDEIWPNSEIRNNGVTIRNGFNVIIDNVHVSDARSGGIVLERGCRQIIVSNSSATANYYDGLAAYETEDSVFFNLNLSNNKAAGISFDLNLNKNYILKTTLENNKEIGIFIRHSNQNEFRDATVSHSDYGVFIAESELSNSAAKGNLFENFSFVSNKTAFQINNLNCVGNKILNPTFTGNTNNVVFVK